MEIKRKILLVEDEKPYQRALSLKLENSDFEVLSVDDGSFAMDILSKEKFDLILLDLVMPKVNGFLVLEYMKNNNINIPTIILSNLSQEEDKEKAKSLGALDFIEKANTPIINIINKIKEILK